MPTDPEGRELKLGDKVLIPAFIKGIHNNELALEPELGAVGEKAKVRLEADQVYRLNPGDDVYTGIPTDDGDGDADDSGVNNPPPLPADPGGD